EALVMVVSCRVAVACSRSLALVGCSPRSPRPPPDLAPDSFFGEDGIDLADGLAESLVRAHGQGPLHGLGAGENDLDRHARASLGDLLNADADRANRHVRVGRAVRSTSVAEENATRRGAVEYCPVAVRRVG